MALWVESAINTTSSGRTSAPNNPVDPPARRLKVENWGRLRQSRSVRAQPEVDELILEPDPTYTGNSIDTPDQQVTHVDRKSLSG